MTDGAAEIDDTARLRRRYRRLGQVELDLIALGACLRERCSGAGVLGLQRLDLPLRQAEGGLRARQRRLLLM